MDFCRTPFHGNHSAVVEGRQLTQGPVLGFALHQHVATGNGDLYGINHLFIHDYGSRAQHKTGKTAGQQRHLRVG